MNETVAFDKQVSVGDYVAYPVFARGTKKIRRIKITHIEPGVLHGFDPDDHLHRRKKLTNLNMVVLNAAT